MRLAHLHLDEQQNGASARSKFDYKIIEEGWDPCNGMTLNYYNENKGKIQRNQELRKDLSDVEFQGKATMQELYHDFAVRYENAEVDSVEKYFALLKDEGAHTLFYKALMQRDNFEKMAEHLDDYFHAQQENPDILKDLANHVKELDPQERCLEEIIECIEATEHAGFIKDICKFLILR